MRYKMIFAILAGLALAIMVGQSVHAQADEDFQAFTGAGFASSPSVGQLDSDDLIVTGMSDGDLAFGGNGVSGDFARGSSAGGVTTGGIYAFDTGGGNTILGVQPGGSDFTPGTFVYRWTNNTATTVTALDIEYVIWSYNDQGRSTSLNFAYAADCTTYTDVPSLDFTTTEAADPSPTWASTHRSTSVLNLSIGVGDTFCLQWTGDDVGGSGSRDEYGIDDITVTPAAPNLIELVSFTARAEGDTVNLAWETAIEIDNAGFYLYRRAAGEETYVRLNSTLIAAQATSGGGASYQLRDTPGSGQFDYLLEDVDTSGRTTRHGPVRVGIGQSSQNLARQNAAREIYLPAIPGH